MKADNKYLILGIGMAVIAAILTTVTVLLYLYGDIVVLFLGFSLGAPVLLPYIALLVILVKSLGKKDRFHKTSVVLCILIALIMPAGCVVTEMQNSHFRFFHTLPDGTEMTIWKDYIIFEHYEKNDKPTDNYLYVGLGQENYSFRITPDNNLFLWVENRSGEVSVMNPRYRLGGIYEGEVGEYWYNAEWPISKQQVSFNHAFVHDGIFTGGSYEYIIMNQDSVYHSRWSYPSHDYRDTKQTYNKHLSRQEQARQDSTRLEQYLRYNYIQTSDATVRIDYRDSVQYRQGGATALDTGSEY